MQLFRALVNLVFYDGARMVQQHHVFSFMEHVIDTTLNYGMLSWTRSTMICSVMEHVVNAILSFDMLSWTTSTMDYLMLDHEYEEKGDFSISIWSVSTMILLLIDHVIRRLLFTALRYGLRTL